MSIYPLVPAKAGTQRSRTRLSMPWIPAFAGMTKPASSPDGTGASSYQKHSE